MSSLASKLSFLPSNFELIIYSVGTLHTFNAHNRVNEHIDHRSTRHLNAHRSHSRTIASRGEVEGAHIEFKLLGYDLGDMVGDACHILRYDIDSGAERAIGIAAPTSLHHTIGVVLPQTCRIRAVGTVDGNTRRDGDKAEDIIALDRVATLRQVLLYVVDLLVNDQRIGTA